MAGRPVSAREPAIAGEHDRLRARPDPELVEEMREVVAYRLLADAETFRDFGVAQPFGQQHQRLALATRQRGERGRIDRLALSRKRQYRLAKAIPRSEEHTSELQSQSNLVCRLLL